MTAESAVALAVCPLEWTPVREVAKLLPPHEVGPMSRILEDLEREGLIETRVCVNPSRVELRRKAVK